MLKSLSITGAAALLAVSLSFADQSQKIIIPVDKTAANDGKQMYVSYCAPCHGTDGKGRGPAATAMKTGPTNLTALMKNNHGKFPDTHVVAVLQFGTEVQAHGSATMPVWGPILGNMNRTNLQDKQLRISNLARYLETIQER
jgi:mono/diheme cytochrome c family protein